MPAFTLEELFGAFASVQGEDANSSWLTVYLNNFLLESSDMPDGKGVDGSTVMTPTQILYALLIRLIKVQAPTINGDPEQRFFIASTGKSLARGERDGQVKQSFTVSFFLNKGVAGIPAVNDIEDSQPQPQEP